MKLIFSNQQKKSFRNQFLLNRKLSDSNSVLKRFDDRLGQKSHKSNKFYRIPLKRYVLEKTSPLLLSHAVGPENVFFNACFDKNNLKTLIAWFLEKYGQKNTIDLVETLKQVGFHQATRAGVSLGIDDLQIPPQKANLLSQASLKMENITNEIQTGNLTSVEKSQRLIDIWNQTSETLRQTAVHTFRNTNPVNPVYMMAFSGARGNISQVRQLVAMRGLMADPQGAILEFPIQSNFREGLTVTEYLISCYGARKGLVDTALRTATSGYLTRRLVDSVQHVVIQVTDCETKKGIFLKDKNLENRLIGRVLLEDIIINSSTLLKKNTLISTNLAKEIAANFNQILVRSPLTCETEKSVCQLCYGLDLAQGKLVSIGEAVGIIAAQSIGEPGTQLTMRTFHTGGVGVFSDQALKSFIAPFDGKINFLESLPGLFVRTPHGNIVYLLKHKINNKNKPFLTLTGSVSPSSKYQIFYDDVPAGSILWVKQGEIVKSGQLLVQASRLQTATQEMPESSHPVRSPISGEVFFQSMAIRVIEEEKRGLQKTKKKKQLNVIPLQINQKEISPTFPTLIELGNFWIFSSFIQKEAGFAKSFFVKGDLISQETPIYQYNLHLSQKGQLKKLNSTVIFQFNFINFLFSKIYYSNLFYYLILSDSKNNPHLLSYTTTQKQTLLHWYPTLRNSFSFSGGYFSVVNTEKMDSGEISKINFNKKNDFSKKRYFYKPHKIVPLKITKKTKFVFELTNLFPDSGFILIKGFIRNQNLGNFLNGGFFQIEKNLEFNKNQINYLKFTFLKNPLHKECSQNVTQDFLKTSLKNSQQIISSKSFPKLIQKNDSWLYISEKVLPQKINSQNAKIILDSGKSFEKIIFSNSPVLTNSINLDNFRILHSSVNLPNFRNFYSTVDILISKKQIFSGFPEKRFFPSNDKECLIFNNQKFTLTKEKQNIFCFYKENQLVDFQRLNFLPKRKHFSSNFLYFQKTSEQIVPTTNILKRKWLLNHKKESSFSIKSPLFTKQNKTTNNVIEKPTYDFNLQTPLHSGWFSSSQFLKIEIPIHSLKTKNKTEFLQQKIILNEAEIFSFNKNEKKIDNFSEIIIPGFNIVYYKKLTLTKLNNYVLETFAKNWIFPEYHVTSAFLKSKKLSEYQGSQKKPNETCLSLVRNQDRLILKIPYFKSSNQYRIGTQVRWGEEIVSGLAIPLSGQIIKLTEKTITLRKGIPLLASIRGLIHVSHNDFIDKNELLITLRSRRLQTEDIVQGIPKIEQLFEARETQGGEIIQNNMHTLLNSFFSRIRQVKSNPEAVQLSFGYIQKFLVDNILQAYSTQGVHIAEKHVEVVVRQMTARVRITEGGDSGLLPGEFIQIKLIEKVNEKLIKLNRRAAQYEPIILGITKSVLQSESFLLAASFQQVSKVLVRSALAKKTDFLRGLHENVLVGQAIPAGTGVVDFVRYLEN